MWSYMYTLTASKTLMIYSESMISLDFKSYPQMMVVSMNRYYVEFVSHYEELNTGQSRQRTMYLYVYAYSPEQVKDILKEYEIITLDQTD